MFRSTNRARLAIRSAVRAVTGAEVKQMQTRLLSTAKTVARTTGSVASKKLTTKNILVLSGLVGGALVADKYFRDQNDPVNKLQNNLKKASPDVRLTYLLKMSAEELKSAIPTAAALVQVLELLKYNSDKIDFLENLNKRISLQAIISDAQDLKKLLEAVKDDDVKRVLIAFIGHAKLRILGPSTFKYLVELDYWDPNTFNGILNADMKAEDLKASICTQQEFLAAYGRLDARSADFFVKHRMNNPDPITIWRILGADNFEDFEKLHAASDMSFSNIVGLIFKMNPSLNADYFKRLLPFANKKDQLVFVLRHCSEINVLNQNNLDIILKNPEKVDDLKEIIQAYYYHHQVNNKIPKTAQLRGYTKDILDYIVYSKEIRNAVVNKIHIGSIDRIVEDIVKENSSVTHVHRP